MNAYLTVKTLHILSSTVLFGTGIGIAFFMFRSYFTDAVSEKLYAARNTVLADYLFTLPAAILQPVTGAWLIWKGGFDWKALWLTATYGIYIFVAMCWLPVVWIQIQLKKILQHCSAEGIGLPERYHKLFKIWFFLGWPAFTGLVIVFFLMVAKPI